MKMNINSKLITNKLVTFFLFLGLCNSLLAETWKDREADLNNAKTAPEWESGADPGESKGWLASLFSSSKNPRIERRRGWATVPQTKDTASAPVGNLEGVVERIDGGLIKYRTASSDYFLDWEKLSSEQREAILNSEVGKRVNLNISRGSIVRYMESPIGVRPDCNELPYDYDELLESARNVPPGGDIMDFLNQIPEGTMQWFTMVPETQSLQFDGVDSSNPRIIRASADGKLIFSYVCNDKGKAYNTVEVIKWNDESSTMEFTSINFRNNNQTGNTHNTEADRVHENPKSCLQCHAPDLDNPDPRWNWAQYPFWPGTYGSQDDNLPPEEMADFRKFKESNADNPCVQNLPWAKAEGNPGYELYPYNDDGKSSNYHLRPNNKFSEILSHLNGKRIHRKLKEEFPMFENVKYLSVMEGLSCKTPEEMTKLYQEAGFPEHGYGEERRERYGGHNPSSAAPNLTKLAYENGFKPADFTMHFNDPDNPEYVTGLGNGMRSSFGDTSTMKLVQAEILKSLGEEDSDFSEYQEFARGQSKAFGPEFACIDDLGGEIDTDEIDRGDLCELLEKKHTEHLPVIAANIAAHAKNAECAPGVSEKEAPIEEVEETINVVEEKLNERLIAAGKVALERTCARCHTSDNSTENWMELPEQLQFFTDENAMKERIERDPGFIEEIEYQLELGLMPLAGEVSSDEALGIVQYMKQLRSE